MFNKQDKVLVGFESLSAINKYNVGLNSLQRILIRHNGILVEKEALHQFR
jgi:hypothetical protein